MKLTNSLLSASSFLKAPNFYASGKGDNVGISQNQVTDLLIGIGLHVAQTIGFGATALYIYKKMTLQLSTKHYEKHQVTSWVFTP